MKDFEVNATLTFEQRVDLTVRAETQDEAEAIARQYLDETAGLATAELTAQVIGQGRDEIELREIEDLDIYAD